MNNNTTTSTMPKPFWVFWAVEFWERFGYYGMQAIIALYFLNYLGFTQTHSILLFGAFSSFVYGFVWVGGSIGDSYLGAKRCIVLGAIILAVSYASLAFATQSTVYFSLAGIIVGNALFKANPSSLISKLYETGDSKLDSAMTLYYMAINIGSFASMSLTPFIAHGMGWSAAFLICAFGLVCGLLSFFTFYSLVSHVSTEAGREPFDFLKIIYIIIGSIISILIVGKLLGHIYICYAIVGLVTFSGFAWFLKKGFDLQGRQRKRMLIAFVLICQGVMFFVLYNQMPTTLTYFAAHNINNLVLGFHIPPAEYQALNPFFILVLSPILAVLYQRFPGTHATKFCVGMTLCALAFLLLWFPQFTSKTGLASPGWMVATYFFQSAGELLVSGLGLAMVAELCPKTMSGFVMGIWFLTTMLAGPIAAWVGTLTVPPVGAIHNLHSGLTVYSDVFAKLGLFTATIAIIMWIIRPFINKIIQLD